MRGADEACPPRPEGLLEADRTKIVDNTLDIVGNAVVGELPVLLDRVPRLRIAVPHLPDGADEPTIRKIDTNATTVVQAFLVGDRTQDDLYDFADDVIADKFASVAGVGEVRVSGANEMQIHVLLDRGKLTAMNLSIVDVVNKLKVNNVRKPLGRIQFDRSEKNVTFTGDYKDLA